MLIMRTIQIAPPGENLVIFFFQLYNFFFFKLPILKSGATLLTLLEDLSAARFKDHISANADTLTEENKLEIDTFCDSFN